ncbi:MAG: hypothetical protein QOG37_1982 [Mycobacterium sp.]|nr:hypothetical protein [Mycobacterium sp.]
MPHIDIAILRPIVASLGAKVVELQPMSLILRVISQLRVGSAQGPAPRNGFDSRQLHNEGLG